MRISVNGEEVETRVETNLAGWMEEQGIDVKAVLVEYNGRITPEEEWTGIILQDGDRLELLQFVGGG